MIHPSISDLTICTIMSESCLVRHSELAWTNIGHESDGVTEDAVQQSLALRPPHHIAPSSDWPRAALRGSPTPAPLPSSSSSWRGSSVSSSTTLSSPSGRGTTSTSHRRRPTASSTSVSRGQSSTSYSTNMWRSRTNRTTNCDFYENNQSECLSIKGIVFGFK